MSLAYNDHTKVLHYLKQEVRPKVISLVTTENSPLGILQASDHTG